MERYSHDFHPSKRSFTTGDSPIPNSAKPNKSWRNLLIYGGVAIGASLLVLIPAWMDFKAPRIISIIADDISGSAQNTAYEKLRHDHCQNLRERYKAGDEIVRYFFADQPEIYRELTVSNQMDTLNLCKETTPKKTEVEIGKHPGTSLILLLEQIQTKIHSLRAQGDKKPVVVTITIQDTEPGQDQPEVDFNRIKELVNAIAQDRGVVAVIGAKGTFQNALETSLNGNTVRVFPLQSIEQAIDWSFKTGRNL